MFKTGLELNTVRGKAIWGAKLKVATKFFKRAGHKGNCGILHGHLRQPQIFKWAPKDLSQSTKKLCSSVQQKS